MLKRGARASLLRGGGESGRSRSAPSVTNATPKPLQVGLIGFGTVGRGTWDVLRRNEEEITRRAGRPIRITWIATRTLDRARARRHRA